MMPKNPSPHTHADADDAPDLSTSEWKGKFSKALLRSAPLEGVDLERVRDYGRDVRLTDDDAPLEADPAPTGDQAKR